VTRPRNKRTRKGTDTIRMTSLMDILVVLLLFLLKSFVVEGDLMTPAQGVELPESSTEDPPRESLVLAVTKDALLLAGEPVMGMREIAAAEGLLLPALSRRLEEAAARRGELARLRGSAAETQALATIQGDRAMPFLVLQKLMYTLGQAGYDNVSLAVVRES